MLSLVITVHSLSLCFQFHQVMLWEDARLGQGLVSDDETARIAGIVDKGSRHPTQSQGSGGLSRTGLEVIGNLGEAEA